jgi:ADP-ribose pyrophosphatase YjhB (NUDIX family)
MILQVGVKVVLRNPEGKFLLLRRAEEKYGKTDGNWDIVGGRIDPGTTLLENLTREVLEETQLHMTTTPTLIAAQDILRSKERHVVRLTYIAETEGEPVLDLSENIEYRWVKFQELIQEPGLDAYVKELVTNSILQEDLWVNTINTIVEPGN